MVYARRGMRGWGGLGAEISIAHTERTNFEFLPVEKEMKSNVKQEPTEKKDCVLESEKEKPKSRSKKATNAVSDT